MPPSQRTELPIPRELDALVLACLEKDPAKRPQSVEAVLDLMNRYRHRAAWDNVAAKAWWDRHLVDLSGPKPASETPTITPSVETTLLSLAG